MSLKESVSAYRALGWWCVPIASGEKRPTLPGWPELRLGAQEFPDAGNVGVILGAISGGLTDVDLDCPEAVELAPLALPATWTFGRKGKPRSHWVYTVAGGMPMRRFLDAKGEKSTTMLECRSNDGGGGRAVQTVFPPSVHPSGEAVRWTEDCDGTSAPRIVSAQELRGAVEKLAVACLLARRGLRQAAEAWLAGRPYSAPAAVLSEVNKLRGQRTTLDTVRAATHTKSETLDAAVAEYNRAHAYEWPKSGGQCPFCLHRGCFGSFPDGGRWVCHSTGHPDGVGVKGEGCYTGDALDLDCRRAGVSRVELLRREGYL
jgi:hypothetical protein